MISGADSRYTLMIQGKPTNAVSHMSGRVVNIDAITGLGFYVANGVRVTVDQCNKNMLPVSTLKVFDLMLMKLVHSLPTGKNSTESGIDEGRMVTLAVREYMQHCHLKDWGESRTQIDRAIADLYNITVEWNEPRSKNGKGSESIYWRARIIDTVGSNLCVKNGRIIVKFSFDMAKYLANAYLMPYPKNLLAVNARKNPHAYYLGRRLAEHHNMNLGKSNADLISITTLLKSCPNLPDYNAVASSAGQVSKRIILPVKRDLDALRDEYGVITSWAYCTENGELLPPEQLNRIDYDGWAKLIVRFELADYPKK